MTNFMLGIAVGQATVTGEEANAPATYGEDSPFS
jgi:hypothetical protein